MRSLFLFLFIIILPLQIFAEDFEERVKDLVAEKIGNQLSFEINFDSKVKLEKIPIAYHFHKDIAPCERAKLIAQSEADPNRQLMPLAFAFTAAQGIAIEALKVGAE